MVDGGMGNRNALVANYFCLQKAGWMAKWGGPGMGPGFRVSGLAADDRQQPMIPQSRDDVGYNR
jgi:hypothetical protein